MTKRRRFTADFKAKVALEALRGDKTLQEIAAQPTAFAAPTAGRLRLRGGHIPNRLGPDQHLAVHTELLGTNLFYYRMSKQSYIFLPNYNISASLTTAIL